MMYRILFSLFAVFVSSFPASFALPKLPAVAASHTFCAKAVTASAHVAVSNRKLRERMKELLDDELFVRSQVGIYVYDLTADELLFEYQSKQTMRPASTVKTLTAVTALYTLGGDYRYRTALYYDKSTGRVSIRAGYDPLFGADDMQAFVQALLQQGVRRISEPIRVDLTLKDTERMGWGWCWDDDTVPLTPLLYQNRDRFTEKLRQALAEVGIVWNGDVVLERLAKNLSPICERTHTIDQILLPMMKKSNNSFAESLFYQLAASSGCAGAGRKQAVAKVHALIEKLGLQPAHYQVADGSGLSLYNYLSPELLGRVLCFAYSNSAIYNHLLPSLPVAGEDGTLRKRMKGTPAAGNVRAKTGTVEGVSTLAGYCTTSRGHVLCFSIMNQGIRRNADAQAFQDRVCEALCR